MNFFFGSYNPSKLAVLNQDDQPSPEPWQADQAGYLVKYSKRE